MSVFFTLLKYIHIGCVTLSFTFFLVRVSWIFMNSPQLKKTWVKTLPHCIDTLLLASGLTMLVFLQYYNHTPNWLIAKLTSVVLYIVCGVVCFRSVKLRKIFTLFAVGFFVTSAHLAITKPPIF